MASLITTDIIRHDDPDTSGQVRSHLLHPQSDMTVMVIVSTPKPNVMSVIEDHLLESISSSEWHYGEEDADFSYVTEKYNHFLSNLALSDMEEVEIILAIEREGKLMISSIGESEIILVEPDGRIVNIHEDTLGHHRFELISSGEIPVGWSVFIASTYLEQKVGETFYSDCANLESQEFSDTALGALAQNIENTTHVIRIRRKRIGNTEWDTRGRSTWNSKIRKLYEQVQNWTGTISSNSNIQTLRERFSLFFERKYTVIQMVFLIVGIVIFFLLVSYIVSTLFSTSSRETKDAKNQVIEAKNLVEASSKLTSNPLAFQESIKKAQTILKDLDSKQLYTKDVSELKGKIEAMKKELYDIQTVDISWRESLVPLNPQEFTPFAIFEKDKKMNIIGKTSIIQDYAVWDTNLQIKPYPSGEVVKDFTVLDDGNIYLLTESNRVLGSRNTANISYVNVAGQNWEKADGIATFNGNIYLWQKDLGQIYKYRPGQNGFSTKANVLSNSTPGILDIGIDGGYYILKADQRIERFAWNSLSGLVLNNLPWEYTVWLSGGNTRLIIGTNLNYVYILDGNRVWIFSPDSRRFQDVKSWRYIAQIEIVGKDGLRDVAVARDGLFYVLTDAWVYDINFEFSDNNVNLR